MSSPENACFLMDLEVSLLVLIVIFVRDLHWANARSSMEVTFFPRVMDFRFEHP